MRYLLIAVFLSACSTPPPPDRKLGDEMRTSVAPSLGAATAGTGSLPLTAPDGTVRQVDGLAQGRYSLESDVEAYVLQAPTSTIATINAGGVATQAWLNANGVHCPAGVEVGPFEINTVESLIYVAKTGGSSGTDFRINKRSH